MQVQAAQSPRQDFVIINPLVTVICRHHPRHVGLLRYSILGEYALYLWPMMSETPLNVPPTAVLLLRFAPTLCPA